MIIVNTHGNISISAANLPLLYTKVEVAFLAGFIGGSLLYHTHLTDGYDFYSRHSIELDRNLAHGNPSHLCCSYVALPFVNIQKKKKIKK